MIGRSRLAVKTRFRVTSRVVASLLVVAATSCGGDSGGSGGPAAMSDDEFCREVERLNSTDPASDLDTALTILEDLGTKAPNKEVRDALAAIRPVIEEMSQIDESDPEAMSRAFELMFSPELVKAGEILNAYSSDVCGLESATTDPALGSGGATGGSPGGGALDSALVSNATEELVAGMGSSATLASAAVQAIADGTLVQVDFVDSDDALDVLAICNALRLLADGVSGGANVEIEISVDGSPVARKATDQTCTEV